MGSETPLKWHFANKDKSIAHYILDDKSLGFKKYVLQVLHEGDFNYVCVNVDNYQKASELFSSRGKVTKIEPGKHRGADYRELETNKPSLSNSSNTLQVSRYPGRQPYQQIIPKIFNSPPILKIIRIYPNSRLEFKGVIHIDVFFSPEFIAPTRENTVLFLGERIIFGRNNNFMFVPSDKNNLMTICVNPIPFLGNLARYVNVEIGVGGHSSQKILVPYIPPQNNRIQRNIQQPIDNWEINVKCVIPGSGPIEGGYSVLITIGIVCRDGNPPAFLIDRDTIYEVNFGSSQLFDATYGNDIADEFSETFVDFNEDDPSEEFIYDKVLEPLEDEIDQREYYHNLTVIVPPRDKPGEVDVRVSIRNVFGVLKNGFEYVDNAKQQKDERDKERVDNYSEYVQGLKEEFMPFWGNGEMKSVDSLLETPKSMSEFSLLSPDSSYLPYSSQERQDMMKNCGKKYQNVQTPDGKTLFMRCILEGDLSFAQILLEAFGKNRDIINQQDFYGNTSLHWAYYYDFQGGIMFLLQHNAKTNITNKYGLIPIEYLKPQTMLNHLEKETKIIQTVSGENHSLFLSDQKKVYVSGKNVQSSLGVGDGYIRYAPTLLELPEKIEKIVCLGNKSFLISKYGKLYGFGSNFNGELGIDSMNNNLRILPNPVLIPFFENKRVVDVSGGRNTTFVTVLKQYETPHMYYFGKEIEDVRGGYVKSPKRFSLQEPVSKNVVVNVEVKKIIGGIDFMLFISDTNEMYGVGNNNVGQVGAGKIEYLKICTQIKLENNEVKINDISCGTDYTVLVDSYGLVYCFGGNKFGQLGLGDLDNRLYPAINNYFRQTRNIKRVSCQYYRTVFLSSKNELYICGVGYGSIPIQLKLQFPHISDLSSGHNFTHVTIKDKQEVYLINFNSKNQLKGEHRVAGTYLMEYNKNVESSTTTIADGLQKLEFFLVDDSSINLGQIMKEINEINVTNKIVCKQYYQICELLRSQSYHNTKERERRRLFQSFLLNLSTFEKLFPIIGKVVRVLGKIERFITCEIESIFKFQKNFGGIDDEITSFKLNVTDEFKKRAPTTHRKRDLEEFNKILKLKKEVLTTQILFSKSWDDPLRIFPFTEFEYGSQKRIGVTKKKKKKRFTLKEKMKPEKTEFQSGLRQDNIFYQYHQRKNERDFVKYVKYMNDLTTPDGKNLIIMCIVDRNLEFVKRILEHPKVKYDVNYVDNYGNTALHHAYYTKYREAVMYLESRNDVRRDIKNVNGVIAQNVWKKKVPVINLDDDDDDEMLDEKNKEGDGLYVWSRKRKRRIEGEEKQEGVDEEEQVKRRKICERDKEEIFESVSSLAPPPLDEIEVIDLTDERSTDIPFPGKFSDLGKKFCLIQ